MDDPRRAAERFRPQSLLFTVLGRYMLHRDVAASSSTFITVLDRLGVAEQAARSTLSRMVARGHLDRHRSGRKAYYAISERLDAVLREGESRVYEAPVRPGGDTVWTLLTFSIPESQRADRHSLRRTLEWRGFGLLRNGLWIAPGPVDIVADVERLGLDERVEVFVGRPAPPTRMSEVVRDAWDLDAIATGYTSLLADWSEVAVRTLEDPLAAHVVFLTQWRDATTRDPVLPLDHLPDGWPATRAHQLFQRLDAELAALSTTAFDRLLDAMPPVAGRPGGAT